MEKIKEVTVSIKFEDNHMYSYAYGANDYNDEITNLVKDTVISAVKAINASDAANDCEAQEDILAKAMNAINNPTRDNVNVLVKTFCETLTRVEALNESYKIGNQRLRDQINLLMKGAINDSTYNKH